MNIKNQAPFKPQKFQNSIWHLKIIFFFQTLTELPLIAHSDPTLALGVLICALEAILVHQRLDAFYIYIVEDVEICIRLDELLCLCSCGGEYSTETHHELVVWAWRVIIRAEAEGLNLLPFNLLGIHCPWSLWVNWLLCHNTVAVFKLLPPALIDYTAKVMLCFYWCK